MKNLLDTHTFLWFVSGNDKLSIKVRKIIQDKQSENYISIASLWEISIKVKLGKLKINGSFESMIDDIITNDFKILPINFAHITQNFHYDFYHKDPFDRIIVAQAEVENMTILSKDTIFDKYFTNNQRRVW